MSFRRRTFPEVLDNLLTAVSGGVSAESQPFPPPGANGPPYSHSLEQPPVAEIISVYGTRGDQSHVFRNGVDYALSADRTALEWKPQAELPDSGTLVYVNYYPSATERVLTDISPGSVVRTLAESTGLELARLYAELGAVYDSGFVDSATGTALDNVVSLLGIERVRGGRAAGDVEFTRAPGSVGAISIPASTRVTTTDGSVEYETVAQVTLAPGQSTIRVRARDVEPNKPLDAGKLTVLPIPIADVAGVTNPAPTTISTQDETDEQLRTRAKSYLHGSEAGTLGAIRQAIALQQATADVVEGASVGTDGATVTGTPGVVTIKPQAATPEIEQRLRAAVEAVRPAGIVVEWATPTKPKRLDLEFRLGTAANLLEQQLRGVHDAVRAKVGEYVAQLPTDKGPKVNQLVGAVLSVSGVQDVDLVAAALDGSDVLSADGLGLAGQARVLGDVKLDDANLPTQLTVTISYAQDAPPDRPTIEQQLAKVLATLNTADGGGNGDGAKRQLTYHDLLADVPLPQDATVQFTFTLESGASRVLKSDPDAYELTPFERLALRPLELAKKAGGGA